jgi:hypothetical protein
MSIIKKLIITLILSLSISIFISANGIGIYFLFPIPFLLNLIFLIYMIIKKNLDDRWVIILNVLLSISLFPVSSVTFDLTEIRVDTQSTILLMVMNMVIFLSNFIFTFACSFPSIKGVNDASNLIRNIIKK